MGDGAAAAGVLWRRAREIFDEAVTVDAAALPALLERRCGNNGRLKEAVTALLEHDREADEFLARPVVDPLQHRWLGGRLGPYRLLESLGQGSGGVVFLAAREAGDFDQRVAVKILRRARTATTRDWLERFEQERQILAQLNHPHIARLLDGGSTADGYPYVVMELVDGEPITDYCDKRRLPLEERLRLFQQVCAAVAHAHRHLVIHRDLKPSNILVAEPHQVKLLDFGIAKRLEESLPRSRGSKTSDLWLTPAYASPEQILGAPISVASDVYSLGVLLYELLTGRLPHQLETSSTVRTALQSLPPPSAAVGTCPGIDPEEIRQIAARRRATPAQLRRQLKDDLDHIVLRALRDEPQNRYSDADALAREVERHLTGLPVEARRGNRVYRLSKLVRRHPLSIATAAVLASATLAFATFAFHQSLRLAEERDIAERERIAVETVADALVDVVQQRQPLGGEALKTATKRTLDRTTADVEYRFADRPLLRARLLAALGWVYRDLAFFDDADRLLSRSLKEHRNLLGEGHIDTAGVLHDLVALRSKEGRWEEAQTLARRALEISRSGGAGEAKTVTVSLHQLGNIHFKRGAYDQARRNFEEAVAIGEAFDEITPLIHADSLNGLAMVLKRQGDLEGARERYTEALRINRRESDPRSRDVGTVLGNLASLALTEGDLENAESYYRESLSIIRHHHGDDHPDVEILIANLASVLHIAGDYTDAELLYRDALESARRRFGGEHPSVAIRLANLGMLLLDMGRLTEAGELLTEALSQQQRQLGDHADTASTLNNLGLLALERGEPELADRYLRQAVVMHRRVLGESHWLVGNGLKNLAKGALAGNRHCEAASLAETALAIYGESLPAGHWRRAEAESILGAALGRLGDRERAAQLLESGIAVLDRARGENSRDARQARARWRQHVEAAPGEPRTCPQQLSAD